MSHCFINLLTELKSLMLHLNSLSIKKKKIAFLKRRAGAFIALAKVFAHLTSKTAEDTLLIRVHY